jgi:RimJ/RimL family protein N-acetyltransferase
MFRRADISCCARGTFAQRVIDTPRLILREWRDTDRPGFIELCRSAQVMAHLGGPADAAQADKVIARARASQDARGFCFWAMERRDDSAFLGLCGLNVVELAAPISGEIEIGWRLREDMWGRGYAREAALATPRWAWLSTQVERVVAMTVPSNRRSWGLMERIGMIRNPPLDFSHPFFPANHPLRRHIVYTVGRPA